MPIPPWSVTVTLQVMGVVSLLSNLYTCINRTRYGADLSIWNFPGTSQVIVQIWVSDASGSVMVNPGLPKTVP